MTVQSQQTSVFYTGNGTTAEFAYPFRILDATHLQVFLDGVRQVAGFGVSNVGNQNGGTVIFDTAPASGVIISFIRRTPLTQDVDYQAYDAFPAETHERALDKLTMLEQEGDASLIRAIHAPNSEAVGEANLVLPDIPNRAGMWLGFTAQGDVAVFPAPVSITDHGLLAGLADDDHTQYFNQARGDLRYLQLAGGTLTGPLVLPADPVQDSEAATKRYVDASSTLKWKQGCRLATGVNTTLSGLAAVDGVVPVDGDRILVNAQTNPVENGIYNAHAAAWTRSADADQEGELESGTSVNVSEGTLYAGAYLCTIDPADEPWTPGTDGSDWTVLSSPDFAQLDARYVNVDGDTMTGLLTANGGIVSSNSVNAALGFYFGSGYTERVYQSGMGYSPATYPVMVIDPSGILSFNYDPVTNLGGQFNNGSIIFPNNSDVIAPDAANTTFIGVFRVNTDGSIQLGADGVGANPGIVIAPQPTPRVTFGYGITAAGIISTLDIHADGARLIAENASGQQAVVDFGTYGPILTESSGQYFLTVRTDMDGRLSARVPAGSVGVNAIGARFVSTSDPITAGQPATEGDIWYQV